METEAREHQDPEKVLRLRSRALDWLPVGEEIVALDQERDLYLGANKSAATLWQTLVDGATRSQLIDLLVSTFDIDTDQAGLDVDAFIGSLSEHQLLEKP